MLHLLDPAVFATLPDWLNQHGHPPYRAGQVRQWLFNGRVESFEQMTNLPIELRGQLAADFQLWTAAIEKQHRAADSTEKLLLRLADGNTIECVLLRDGQRRTICISSQVGCAMGCVFCASGLDGVVRNLTAGEIVEQMLRLARLLPPEERLSHIVVMGMGEPLANLDRLLPALGEATSPAGLGISHRRITISTVGLPPAIDRLSELDARFQLAVSLHAPDDELRNQLVPVNKNTGLQAIVTAADRYFDVSGRRLTFEYVLLGGLNDEPAHAKKLANLLRGRLALLNLIPYNPVAGLPYVTPAKKAVQRFVQILEEAGLNVQIRERKGDEINAACGQLRRTTDLVGLTPHGGTERNS
jgi:23S rRNA (adenine2503-C2)-methyltransferase